MSYWITEHLQWVFVAILLLNLAQRRRYDTAAGKRLATLYIATGLIAVYAAAHMIRLLELSDWLLLPVGGAVAIAIGHKKGPLRAFRLRCAECNTRLSLAVILYNDSNLCRDCRAHDAEAHSSEKEQ